MTEQNTKLGIWLMIAVTFIFAAQDGISRHLAEAYNVQMIIMIRYWFFCAFAFAIAHRAPGGIKRALHTTQPVLQFARGTLLALEVVVMIIAFVKLGLVESHAIFAIYPLIVMALSGPVLGEKIGWRRWLSVGVGFIGVLVILKPQGGVFSTAAFYPLVSAAMFAVYGVLIRYVSLKDDAPTTFLWTGISGVVVMTLVGMWYWEPMASVDWLWMIGLCFTAVLGHYLMTKAYAIAEASAIQPFAYFQLVFGAMFGVAIFGDVIRPNVAIGAVIVVSAGVFALLRARINANRQARANKAAQAQAAQAAAAPVSRL
ncbi:EamA-like transporter family protein [Aquimixticola soesokkakensis]|uniref:EamA-like transporter family protein n=1 Tax=Aquimixticola soesokkakensis TaxID=1519096 RepID=A0A1Y5RKL4_9RHOB|nr:DMT family transporter [Aquimixticola soesokkakensis]SLN16848.1 EamA-like transporter family protein [Aquimixticola soesokkakensis]